MEKFPCAQDLYMGEKSGTTSLYEKPLPEKSGNYFSR